LRQSRKKFTDLIFRTSLMSRRQLPKAVRGLSSPGAACRKRINTMTQFLDHPANDAMPQLIGRLARGTRADTP
jgi:hypothetical protein